MDHFNVTVTTDGAVIATRRGLQVSKQKHHGISFVNSYCPQADVPQGTPRQRAASTASVDLGKPLQQRWRFVTKDMEGQRIGGSKVRAKPTAVHAAKVSNQVRRAVKRPTATANLSAARRLTPASSSPSSSDSDEPPSPLDGTALPLTPPATGIIIPSLPLWASVRLPMTMSEQRLFLSYFNLVPRKMYPFENILTFNPARSPQFFSIVINDQAVIHCVLMCNAMFRSVLAGQMNSEELSFHISKICHIINIQLGQRHKKIPDNTIECITTLALMGNFIGRYDHWHVHMTGLKKMIELNDRWDDMRPALIDKIRKTDIKGAATLGTIPYLPFTRTRANISDALPLSTRTSTATTMHRVLAPLNISPIVISSLSALSIFMQALYHADHAVPARSVLYEPHAFTEEAQWVQHELVVHPGPLRASASSDPDTTKRDVPPVDATRLRTESLVLNHLVPLTIPIIPAPGSSSGPGGALEPALRIAALLYFKELMPDFPRNLGGYSVLLELLRLHVAALIRRYGWDDDEGGAANKISPPTTTISDGASDGGAGAGPADVGGGQDGEATRAALRPAMVWMCLVGDAVSRVADANECRFGRDRYAREVYAAALDGVMGSDSTDRLAGDLTDDGDLALCRLLDLRRIRGERWEDRIEVGRMLAGRRMARGEV